MKKSDWALLAVAVIVLLTWNKSRAATGPGNKNVKGPDGKPIAPAGNNAGWFDVVTPAGTQRQLTDDTGATAIFYGAKKILINPADGHFILKYLDGKQQEYSASGVAGGLLS